MNDSDHEARIRLLEDQLERAHAAIDAMNDRDADPDYHKDVGGPRFEQLPGRIRWSNETAGLLRRVYEGRLRFAPDSN